MSNKYPGGIITSGANAGYSVFFDGTGDYLTGTTGTATQFSGNFTVEAWIYVPALPSAATATVIFASQTTHANATGIMFGPYGNTGAIGVFTNNAWTTYSSNPITANAWWHVALVRSGTTVSIYTNGTLTGSFTSSQNYSDGGIRIGTSRAANNDFSGYISNLRVNNSTALYTANFTPPTQLLANSGITLLTCNSPAIVDQSSNAITLTPTGTPTVSTFTPFTGTQLVPNPNTLANTQGVWSISDAAYWMSQNKWPMPPNYPLQSLRFNSADSAYLGRTPASASNRKTWTWSGWVKRSALSNCGLFGINGATDTDLFSFRYESDTLKVAGSSTLWLQTTQVFRDVSAWAHVVLAVDTTQATAANRMRLYINGAQVTALSTAVYPTQNADLGINRAALHYLGADYNGSSFFNGYMADITFVDGQALTPSSFGANDPNTGVWSPVPYSGTYGTNGFRLSFQDNTGTTATTLGKDYSGNGNNWTPNNFSVAAGSGNDSLTDGPTNWGIDYGNGGEVRGNYATLNPLVAAGGTFTNGNLDFTAADNGLLTPTTVFPSSGKWYCEIVWNSGVNPRIGVTNTAGVGNNLGSTANSWAYLYDGRLFNNNAVGNNTGVSATTGDIIMLALDIDAGKLWYGKNGVWMPQTTGGSNGSPATGANATQSFTANQTMSFAVSSGGGTPAWTANFGQRPFAYPAPSGFKVLCTTNLPIPTVGATSTTLASRYMDVLLYTGNGSSRSITGLNFQPDFVWIKSRSSASWWHQLQDAVRGATKRLASNENVAEATDATTLTSFNSDGFSLGTSTSYNNNTDTYVAWNWNAGGSTVTNTSGAISSQVRANTTAGVSIVTYTGNGSTTGATVGHGLSAAPRLIIVKDRTTVDNWLVQHASLGATGFLNLNGTGAFVTSARAWNNTAPTSSVFTVNTFAGEIWTNKSGDAYVAYCFAEIAGFSKFGSYTGNGSADGVFVYLGFRPRFIMGRDATGVDNWWIYDSARNTYNVANSFLRPNLADAEGSNATDVIDFLSNGFKIRGASNFLNENGNTFIYAAFAESPFNYSRAR